MTAFAVEPTPPNVVLDGDHVLIVDFREGDREFVDLIRDSENPALITHDCLVIGARALRSAETSIDTTLVDHRFTEYETRLERGVGQAVEQIGDASRNSIPTPVSCPGCSSPCATNSRQASATPSIRHARRA